MNDKLKKIESDLPVMIIFGRTNVGKSTLFNKITGRGQALTSKFEGTTRDSNQAQVNWQGRNFTLVDSGGIMNTQVLAGRQQLKKLNTEDDIDTMVQLRSRTLLKNAEIVLLVVDAKTGLLPQDKEMALLLKKIIDVKKIILVANKVDSPNLKPKTAEFYQLALGDPWQVSAANGSGVGDLLEKICKNIPKTELSPVKEIRVTFIGQPNVGKSSLLNSIAGEKKIIVSAQPHTTREPQDMVITYQGQYIRFVDTAGIIKQKSKMNKQRLIKSGIDMSLKALKRSDIALLVLDIHKGISHHETKLVDKIIKEKINLIIVANKWDLVAEKDAKTYQNKIYGAFPFVAWAPIIFLSAQNKTKNTQLLNMILQTYAARQQKIDDEELAKFLASAIRHASPLANTKVHGIMKHKIIKPKLKKLTQTYVNPPEFTLEVKTKFGLKDNYIKYLKKRLQDKFNFFGCPITLIIRHQN